MTKRIKAAWHYHGYHERRCSPNKHRDGAQVERALARLPAYDAILSTARDLRCYGCDCLIEPGATAFACQGHSLPAPVLCFTCGVGWCIHSGSKRVEDFDHLPAIGGPILS